MDKIVIWGATGQAIVLEELLSDQNIQIVAYFENNSAIKTPNKDIPIYYGNEGLIEWKSKNSNAENYNFLVAIGGSNGGIRGKISILLKQFGFKPFTAFHRTAFVANNSTIGESAQILANASVCARVRIGANCIINTGASVDHECIISDGVHIGPGAKLAGCVIIGRNSFIGTGAIILPRIKIGDNVVVGAGSVVTKNIPDNSVVYGNPAKLQQNTLK